MCQRVLITGEKRIATFAGKKYNEVSIDARCTFNPVDSVEADTTVLSFGNSDKPGVVVVCRSIDTVEFTDSIPEGALEINYVEPEVE